MPQLSILFAKTMVLGRPRFREPISTVDDEAHHTRCDNTRVWPSASRLHIEFSVIATVTAITGVLVLFMIVALLRSKKVRSKPFNMYLLFSAIPDCASGFLCCMTCSLSATKSQYYSEPMCGFQAFYLNFAIISNAWLNALIVFQIHKMLRYSKRCRRYAPPSHKQVVCEATLVYAYAICWGFLSAFNIPFLPQRTHIYYGSFCMPMESELASGFFVLRAFLYRHSDGIFCLLCLGYLKKAAHAPIGSSAYSFHVSFPHNSLVLFALGALSHVELGGEFCGNQPSDYMAWGSHESLGTCC